MGKHCTACKQVMRGGYCDDCPKQKAQLGLMNVKGDPALWHAGGARDYETNDPHRIPKKKTERIRWCSQTCGVKLRDYGIPAWTQTPNGGRVKYFVKIRWPCAPKRLDITV